MTSLIREVAAGIAPPLRTLTVHDVQKMLDSGVLAEGEPIELIDGVLVLKDRRDPGMPEGDPMPHGPEHPTAGRYSDQTVVSPGDDLRRELPGTGPIEIAVAELLPEGSPGASAE